MTQSNDDIRDKAIETLEDAEAYFKAMGCSHFHMHREMPPRMFEYWSLNVSKSTETQWCEEDLQVHFQNILDNKTPVDRLWRLHSYMADLIEMLETKEALEIMLEATDIIRNKLPSQHVVIVAESIVGTGSIEMGGRGLFLLAHNLDDTSALTRFNTHVTELCEIEVSERSERCLQTRNEVLDFLGYTIKRDQ